MVIATVYISVSRLLNSKSKSNTNFRSKQINSKELWVFWQHTVTGESDALILTKMTQCRDVLFAKVDSKPKYAPHSLLGQVFLYFNSNILV